jgi:O-methyltransferase involved in polyketide biosynthesis/GNAT superfamily N-acetyltransferase
LKIGFSAAFADRSIFVCPSLLDMDAGTGTCLSNMSLSAASPVAKTAFDALQAKRSAFSVGYKPFVVAEEDIYKDLLDRVTSESKFKRQTPLVNAGYAVRVLAVSRAIKSFVDFHQRKNTKQIQIVLLGCGMDVIGLWAGLLDPDRLKIVEVDTQEVCLVKKDLLLRHEMIEAAETSNEGLVNMHGRIIGNTSDANKTGLGQNYLLTSADLRDIPQLEQSLSDVLDKQVPTLAISELVLSYLAPTETDQLLRWCATRLCATPGSVMVALEPLGASLLEGNAVSVIEGYRRTYCRQFGAKLDRGTSNPNKECLPTSFHPMGVSADSVSQRLSQAGFEVAHTDNIGKAGAYAARPKTFETPEIFDEHAALTAHLQSYIISFGFSSQTEVLLRRLMCPWAFAAEKVEPILGSGIILTVVEAMDEIPVQTLFLTTYEHVFEKYPAVRKMAKTALKTDLAISLNDCESAIATRYKALGGSFFVAIIYDVVTGARRVVGCLGVRPCENKSEEPNSLELFRLVVDTTQRRKGIGRNLLNMAEKFAIAIGSPKLIANTLTILESANYLYKSHGYRNQEESNIGDLVIRTYAKPIGRVSING